MGRNVSGVFPKRGCVTRKIQRRRSFEDPTFNRVPAMLQIQCHTGLI